MFGVSVNPLTVAIAFAALCIGAFLVGLRFYRMAEPPENVTLDQARRFGRLLMMGATAMLLFLAAVILRGEFPLTAKG